MVKKSKSSLLKILKNPHKISDSEAMFIDELVKEFPYFQAARAIQLKNHKNLESFQFEKNLNKTAIYTSNRRILFDFIEHNFLADNIKKLQKQLKTSDFSFLYISLLYGEFHLQRIHLHTK